jgi:hypothetical protein
MQLRRERKSAGRAPDATALEMKATTLEEDGAVARRHRAGIETEGDHDESKGVRLEAIRSKGARGQGQGSGEKHRIAVLGS